MTKARDLANLISSGNIFSDGAVAASEVTGLANSATVDTTNATNITSGTLPAARLPAFSGDATSTSGTSALTLANSGVVAGTYTKLTVDSKGRATVGGVLASADLPTYTGTLTSSQITTGLGFTPYNSTNPSGYISGNQNITFSGDATGSGTTTVSLTLANSGVTAGTYGSSTAVPVVVVDSKGRVTSLSTQSISGSLTFTGDVTGTGTTGSSTALTLANSGVTAGTYTKVTVDAKGRATSGTTLSASDIPNLDASIITSGTIAAARLPSYVDDVLEAANLAAFPASGETGKIYVALDNNKTYRWSGSAYIEISASPGSTDAVTEGSTNLYFTNARARGSISVTQNLTYNSTTGVITGPNLSSYLTGNQTITFSGDATGSGATSVALTLANSGVTAGTYTKVTVDAKGRVTTGATLASADLPTYTGTITSSQVTTALGFTPYNSTNPNGYTSNVGTVTSVSGTGTVSGLTLTGTVTGSGSLTLGGSITGFLPTTGGTLTGKLISNGGDLFRLFESQNASASNAVQFYIEHNLGGTNVGNARGSLNLVGTSVNIASAVALHAANYTSYAPSLTGSGASGTWGIGITGAINGINIQQGNVAQNVKITTAGGSDSGVSLYNSSGTWLSQWYATSGSYGFLNGNWAGWDIQKVVNGQLYLTIGGTQFTALHSNNYTSYSPSLTGSGASGTWSINVTGSAGSVSGLTLTSSSNGVNPDSVTQNQLGYNTSISLFGQTDGGLYSSAYSSSWIHQIYGDFRTGQIATRGKNNGTWQAWRVQLDSGNYTSYALPLTGGGLTGRTTISVNGRTTSYTGSNLELYTGDNTPPGISFHRGGYSATLLYESDGELYTQAWTTRAQTGKLLSSGNYTSYSPTLTGSGASGTWGINITGNAATVTTVTPSQLSPAVDYTTPADASGYTWIRFEYANGDSFNGGQHQIEFYVTRSINFNSNNPYGGCTAKFTAQAREWHSGQEMMVVQYGEHGANASAGQGFYITNARIADQAGSGYWVYLRVRSGITYRFREALHGGAGCNFSTLQGTTDPGSGQPIFAGLNLLATGSGANYYYNGSAALHAGNYTSYSPSLTGSGASGTWGISITGNAANVTGTVSAANGGTGRSTLTANNIILGNGTSAVSFVAPGASGQVLTSNGTTWVSQAPTAGGDGGPAYSAY